MGEVTCDPPFKLMIIFMTSQVNLLKEYSQATLKLFDDDLLNTQIRIRGLDA